MAIQALAANEILSREERIERLTTMRSAYLSWAEEMGRQIAELERSEPRT